eukprot:CAMPEP_0119139858 /NCGR_PEP_ID=MMETSP1310-20130426/28258_1 /TAXON_ID=464262 /ORGANISM="Genus nov. species nov., Strain RCC2339" /LENGTH=181 /DNA_ID=CAMNT_0007131183 /DNA_START=6 /DNA_END=548 /DNA_ORIENTATION=+
MSGLMFLERMEGVGEKDTRDFDSFMKVHGLSKFPDDLLIEACRRSPEWVIRRLVTHGADVTLQDEQGNTATHVFCARDLRQWEDWAALGVLSMVMRAVSVNAMNESSQTPLHCIFQGKGNQRLLLVLLAHGADLHIKNQQGDTPYDLLQREGQFAHLRATARESCQLLNVAHATACLPEHP